MEACLQGIRVLDLTRVLAGPWCTQNLADLGAEVIKIERPGVGDETRLAGPPFLKSRDGEDTPDAAYFLSANRGKKSVAVNLAAPEGQAIVRALAEKSDILVENYKVGDLAKYGLGYEDLRKVNPRLIYCAITGYGQTGPYRSRAGYDFVFQAMGGLMSITGEPEGTPQKVGVAFSDLMTGMYATVAVLAALAHRQRTGEGQFIDLALLDVQIASLANMNLNYFCSGRTPPRMGNAHANLVPYQVFACSDGHIVVAAGNSNHFRQLCVALGMPQLADDTRFSDNPGRVRNREALIAILEAVFSGRPGAAWMELLDGSDVPCARINTIPQVFEDPQVKAREMEIKVDHPLAGPISLVASPMRFSGAATHYTAPPLLAEHTDAVLGTLLGYSESELAALGAKGVIARRAD